MQTELKHFLDLSKIFRKLEDENYCIVKLPKSFPLYEIGSDLDIFCYDIKSFSKIILSNLQELDVSKTKIKINTAETHVYIDIIRNKKIHFRFDLYGALPSYKNINIKNAFFGSVIEHSKRIKIDGLNIAVPSNIDEAILRYIEYQEWYSQRPDKIKHIDYIKNKMQSNDIDLKKMFDRLHYYTSIPDSITQTRPTKLSGKAKRKKARKLYLIIIFLIFCIALIDIVIF